MIYNGPLGRIQRSEPEMQLVGDRICWLEELSFPVSWAFQLTQDPVCKF